MKKTLTLAAILFVSTVVFTQTTAIPDAVFEQALINQGYDFGVPNGSVPTANINKIKKLEIDSLGITDITGIKDFSALEMLMCQGNAISSIDISNNAKLWLLYCGHNNLTSIDVSNNLPLKQLGINNNYLTSLDVTKNINLTLLSCHQNKITSLDVSNNTLLSYFTCYENALTSLDVTNDTALVTFSCGTNSITGLDLSNNKKLQRLACPCNPLKTLDVSNNTKLTFLWCGSDSLSSLDVSKNTELSVLITNDNPLHSLDVSKNTLLKELISSNNLLTALDVSNNPLLERLYFGWKNYLTSLDVSKNPNLKSLGCSSNLITSLDLSNNPLLEKLWCNNNKLTSLNLRNGNNGIIDTLFINNNPRLFCVAVDNPWISYSKWITIDFKKDGWTQYTDGTCRINKIKGFVFDDKNKNCFVDIGEKGVPQIIVKAKAKGSAEIYSITNDLGFYELRVDTNELYQVSVAAAPGSDLLQGFCHAAGIPVNSGAPASIVFDKNFGLDLKSCAELSLDITKYRMRRCFIGNTNIIYRNTGSSDQLNAAVFVDFPEYMTLVSASENYTVVDAANGIYKFSFDKIPAFSNGTINITDSVICSNENIRGYTQCIRAWITPKSYCAETKDTTAWDKSSICVPDKVKCEENIARFTIINRGSGNMKTAHNYRLYYNNELAYTGTFQLISGDSLIVNAKADGSTIRLEADQHPLHPGKSHPRTTIEGCGAASPSEASLGFWTQASENDMDDIAEICLIIRDSYDPNDKKVYPEGITDDHYVPEKGALEYTIRFQNAGNDTAYNILILDTLSDQLDIKTLKITGASHQFGFEVLGENEAVLAFTFKNVNLPDSNVNEPGSNGFVSFSINPIDSIKPGTAIENTADIYFDFNSAIRTNTVAVVALDTIINSNKTITVTEGALPAGIAKDELLNICIFPNPSNDFITISGSNNEFHQIKIINVTGQQVVNHNLAFSGNKLDVSQLKSGVYLIQVTNDAGEAYTFKMVKE